MVLAVSLAMRDIFLFLVGVLFGVGATWLFFAWWLLHRGGY